MAYGFRLSFHLVDGDKIGIDAPFALLSSSDGGATVRLLSGARGESIRSFSNASIDGRPYATMEIATEAAKLHQERLLAYATRRKLAIDLGDGFIRAGLLPAGFEHVRKSTGAASVRNYVHGIDVFEVPANGEVVFVKLNLNSALTVGGDAFLAGLEAELVDPAPFDEDERVAAEIFGVCRFVPSFRARFFMLMSGIEALIDAQPREPAVQIILDDSAKRIHALTDDEASSATKRSSSTSLKLLKQESIGQAGRRLAKEVEDRTYLNLSGVEFFRYIYDLRSQLLHSGRSKKADVDLLAVANATSDFLGDILILRLEKRTGRVGEKPRTIEAIKGDMLQDPTGSGIVPTDYQSPTRPKP